MESKLKIIHEGEDYIVVEFKGSFRGYSKGDIVEVGGFGRHIIKYLVRKLKEVDKGESNRRKLHTKANH